MVLVLDTVCRAFISLAASEARCDVMLHVIPFSLRDAKNNWEVVSSAHGRDIGSLLYIVHASRARV